MTDKHPVIATGKSHLTEADLDRIGELAAKASRVDDHWFIEYGRGFRVINTIDTALIAALDPATVHELVQLARLGLTLLDETEEP